MKYVKLFERKDFELSSRIKNIYDELYNQIYSEGIEYRRLNRFFKITLYSNILSSEIWYIFSSEIKNACFGELVFEDGDKIPFIKFSSKLEVGDDEGNLIKVKELIKINKDAYYHELQHFYDYILYGKKFKNFSTSLIKKEKGDKAYYNTFKEINAYFIQHVTKFLNKEDGVSYRSLKSFEEFKYEFILEPSFKEFYINLTDKNKNKINKRLYQIYLDIRNKYSYRYKMANLSNIGQNQKVYLSEGRCVEGIVVKKLLRNLIPNNDVYTDDIMSHEYAVYDKNGDIDSKYVYDLEKPEQLPPMVIDRNNNIIFDYYNVYNIAKSNGLKIVNCIVTD